MSFNLEAVAQKCSVRKVFFEILQYSQGKYPCQSLFFNKAAGFLLNERHWHRCFPVNFAKYLRTPFLIEQLVAASVNPNSLY